MGVSPLDTFASRKSTFLSSVVSFSLRVESRDRQLMSKELRKSAIRLIDPDIWKKSQKLTKLTQKHSSVVQAQIASNYQYFDRSYV
jgi:hypothetical protein